MKKLEHYSSERHIVAVNTSDEFSPEPDPVVPVKKRWEELVHGGYRHYEANMIDFADHMAGSKWVR